MNHDWFVRYAVELEAFSTVALIVVTGVYVVLTGRISSATQDQAKAALEQAQAAERQVEVLGEQLEAQRRQLALLEEDHQQAKDVFRESIKARLEGSAPVVTVEVNAREIRLGQGGAVVYEQDEGSFDETIYEISLRILVRCHGPGPTICKLMRPRWGEWDDWELHPELVIPPDDERRFRWSFRARGEAIRNYLDAAVELVVRSSSVDGSVVDVHTWNGSTPDLEFSGGTVRGLNDTDSSLRIFEQSRTFPGLPNRPR